MDRETHAKYEGFQALDLFGMATIWRVWHPHVEELCVCVCVFYPFDR